MAKRRKTNSWWRKLTRNWNLQLGQRVLYRDGIYAVTLREGKIVELTNNRSYVKVIDPSLGVHSMKWWISYGMIEAVVEEP